MNEVAEGRHRLREAQDRIEELSGQVRDLDAQLQGARDQHRREAEAWQEHAHARTDECESPGWDLQAARTEVNPLETGSEGDPIVARPSPPPTAEAMAAEASALHAEREAREAKANAQLLRLAEERDAARAGMDRLGEELRGLRDELEGSAQEAERRIEAERRELQARWERERQDLVADARLRGEGELDAARLRWEAEAQALRAERDAARLAAEAAARERGDLADRLGAAEDAAREDTRRLRAEVDRLAREVGPAREQAEAAARQGADHAGRARGLQDELDRLRRGRDAEAGDRDRALAELRQELDASRQAREAEVRAHLAEAEQLRAEAAEARRGWDDSQQQALALGAERDSLRAQRDTAEAGRREAELAHHVEAGRLAAALEEARREAEAATLRGAGSAEQVRDLRARLETLERDRATASAAWDAARRRSEGEVLALREERDAARLAAEAAGRERGDLAARLVAAEDSAREDARRLRAELDRLEREAGLAREQAEAAARQGADHAGRARGLQDELDRLRRGRDAEAADRDRALAELRQELLNERVRAAAEGERAAKDNGEAMEELERRLSDAFDDLRVTADRAKRLEAEATAARDQIAGRSEDEAADPSTPDRDERDLMDGGGDLERRHHVEELARQLRQARDANERFRSLLNVFGVIQPSV